MVPRFFLERLRRQRPESIRRQYLLCGGGLLQDWFTIKVHFALRVGVFMPGGNDYNDYHAYHYHYHHYYHKYPYYQCNYNNYLYYHRTTTCSRTSNIIIIIIIVIIVYQRDFRRPSTGSLHQMDWRRAVGSASFGLEPASKVTVMLPNGSHVRAAPTEAAAGLGTTGGTYGSYAPTRDEVKGY
jgi:hypothetical protein